MAEAVPHLHAAWKLLRRGNLRERPLPFRCPITGIHENAVLCQGHVKPQSLAGGGPWVPQRKDVDNGFGAWVEADFVQDAKILDMVMDPKGGKRFLEYSRRSQLNRKIRLHTAHDGIVSPVWPGVEGDALRPRPTGRNSRSVDELHPLAREALRGRDAQLGLYFESAALPQVFVSVLHSLYLWMFHEIGYTAEGAGGVIRSILGEVFWTKGKSIPRTIRNLVKEPISISLIPEVWKQAMRRAPCRYYLTGYCWGVPFCTIHMLGLLGRDYIVANLPLPFHGAGVPMLEGGRSLMFDTRLTLRKAGGLYAFDPPQNVIWASGSEISVGGCIHIEAATAEVIKAVLS